MNLIEMRLYQFLEAVDSDKPAPGGGSVAAYVSALGVALSRMTGHLTINKKKFGELDETSQKEFIKNFDSLKSLQDRLKDIVDEDTVSFTKVMAAYALPKETDKDKEIRNKAIADATLEATKCPMEAALIAYQALSITPSLIEHANKNAISDLASGMFLLQSGMKCSILNVKINLAGLADETLVKEFSEKCESITKQADEIINKNMEIIEGNL